MAERTLLVMSDIEMGAGGITDDFPHDAWFAERLAELTEPYGPADRVDLVFNGDTLDFLRTPVDGGFPAHVTAQIALHKLDAIASAHVRLLAALREFLAGGDRVIHFVVGNHDSELLFPDVQTRLARLLDAPGRVRFPGFEMDVGPVHIEHGSQQDPLFSMPADQPFVEHDGVPILNLPWGALAVMDIWGSLRREFATLDRIKPRQRLFEILPAAKTLMLKRSWQYFSRSFWRNFTRDPLKRLSWPMLKEVTYRFVTADADIVIRDRYRASLQRSTARLFVVGHQHKASRTRVGDKLLITSGFLRNEFTLESGTDWLRPSDKGAVRVRLCGDDIVEAASLRFDAPMPPLGYVPKDIRDLGGPIQRRLAALDA